MNTNLISVAELQNLQKTDSLKIMDCSWHLPTANRDAKEEFLESHIPGAQFFDIDAISDTESELPHMLPSAEIFAEPVSALGISSSDHVVGYDSVGLFSAARVWWTFNVFGHHNVRVLNGGLPAWVKTGGSTSNQPLRPEPGDFSANFNSDLLASYEAVFENLEHAKASVLDARSLGRFNGIDPEPRPNLPSGHIPNSTSVPFQEVLRNGFMRPREELLELFSEAGFSPGAQIITSCGSGVTAAILTLALAECGFGLQRLYDGAWAEWGMRGPIEPR